MFGVWSFTFELAREMTPDVNSPTHRRWLRERKNVDCEIRSQALPKSLEMEARAHRARDDPPITLTNSCPCQADFVVIDDFEIVDKNFPLAKTCEAHTEQNRTTPEPQLQLGELSQASSTDWTDTCAHPSLPYIIGDVHGQSSVRMVRGDSHLQHVHHNTARTSVQVNALCCNCCWRSACGPSFCTEKRTPSCITPAIWATRWDPYTAG